MRRPNFNPTMGNVAIQQAIFKKKMEEAQRLEEDLEAQRFEHDTPAVRVVCSGKPTILELELKRDCSASHILNSINTVLAKAHIYRDRMAQDLIGGK